LDAHGLQKIDLSKEEKSRLGKPSLPRPEMDIFAYDARHNELIWVECKSYFDSRGVTLAALTGEDERSAARYKVFTNEKFREIVTQALIKQALEQGLCRPNPTVKYWLVCGKIVKRDKEDLRSHFEEQGWFLRDEEWSKEKIENLAKMRYEDDIAVIVAKIFARL
jgi:hypothetical protein